MEIGKIYLVMQTDQEGQPQEKKPLVPDIMIKANFRQMDRESQIRILRMMISDLNDLKDHLDKLPVDNAYDTFFSEMEISHPKWRKQRGLL
jgi:hypothetical protein